MLDALMELLKSGGDSLANLTELAQAMATLAKALESISEFFAPLMALFGGLSGLLG